MAVRLDESPNQTNQPPSPMFNTQTSLMFGAALMVCIPSVLAKPANQPRGQNPLRELSNDASFRCRTASSLDTKLPIQSWYPRTGEGSGLAQTLPRYFDQPTPDVHLYGGGYATAVPLPPAIDNEADRHGQVFGTLRMRSLERTRFNNDNKPKP